ncbi:MAG: pyrroline-5-carboxylate reductase [Proteobacteria bacterium]|nr:pyrroline-5-carboxylate reductase [Pseudomonadota bacterium]
MATPITFIGGGNMASAIAGGLIAKGAPAASVRVIEPSAAQRTRLASLHPDIELHAEPAAAAFAGAGAAVFAVKPQQMREAATAAAALIAEVPVVLTIAAGVRCTDLARWLGGYARIARAMPNTPALIGAGISAYYATPDSLDHAAVVEDILRACGDVLRVDDERALDAVTGISGSGPAYVFYFLEALERAARELGFSAADARRLAYATFDGSIRLALASGDDAGTLRERVTSKGGTTARALGVLESAGAGDALVAAVKAAATRAAELGDEFGRDP